MHAAMARIFALLAFCTGLSTQAQPIASGLPAAPAPPVFASMGKKNGAKAVKQRTTLDMRGSHYVSQRALSHVCKDIKLNGMVKATSPRTMLRNRKALANQETPFGTLMQERALVTKKGGTINNPFLHPAAMLWVCCHESNEFKNVFSSVLEGRPRLRLVEYIDEVTPGRELLAYNDKKIWVLYWSFLDFGSAALANEDAWFTGAVVRSHIVQTRCCVRHGPSL